MGNEASKIEVGSKIKRKIEHICTGWKDVCDANNFNVDAIFIAESLDNGTCSLQN